MVASTKGIEPRGEVGRDLRRLWRQHVDRGEVAVCRGRSNSWAQDPRRLETGLAARFSVVTCEEEANDDEAATKKKPRSSMVAVAVA